MYEDREMKFKKLTDPEPGKTRRYMIQMIAEEFTDLKSALGWLNSSLQNLQYTSPSLKMIPNGTLPHGNAHYKYLASITYCVYLD